MARKFLYAVAVLIVLGIAALFALRVWSDELTALAMVPSSEFRAQPSLASEAYSDPAMWLSRPGTEPDNPARWHPAGLPDGATAAPRFAVFFVHPTSYLERKSWNAPLEDEGAKARAKLFVRGMASPFNQASAIWAPRYRQATFGAFLTDKPEASRAIDLAYRDVAQAFDTFVAQTDPDLPIVLAGHSQGALHVLRLLRERIAGTQLEHRIAMVYAIGWPISLEHDLPALPLPACSTPDQAHCIVDWSSFAEPADPSLLVDRFRSTPGFDGQIRDNGPILCVNPLTGTRGGTAPASANQGTLVPDDDLASGTLVAGLVPARCGPDGLLLIGNPPELGPYVLPGNNYHVYDIPLFWRNLQQDVQHRVAEWANKQA